MVVQSMQLINLLFPIAMLPKQIIADDSYGSSFFTSVGIGRRVGGAGMLVRDAVGAGILVRGPADGLPAHGALVVGIPVAACICGIPPLD